MNRKKGARAKKSLGKAPSQAGSKAIIFLVGGGKILITFSSIHAQEKSCKNKKREKMVLFS